MYSQTVENYLKNIYYLSELAGAHVKTNALAKRMKTKASSVSDMLKKLEVQGLVLYTKYHGVKLSNSGTKLALKIIRKHRIWKCFLVQKLNFGWEEVHEIAEELEHVSSDLLIEKLDVFLNHPSTDPHGGLIPNQNSNYLDILGIPLSQIAKGTCVEIIAVASDDKSLLLFLNTNRLYLHQKMEKTDEFNFDDTSEFKVEGKKIILTKEITNKILVKRNEN